MSFPQTTPVSPYQVLYFLTEFINDDMHTLFTVEPDDPDTGQHLTRSVRFTSEGMVLNDWILSSEISVPLSVPLAYCHLLFNIGYVLGKDADQVEVGHVDCMIKIEDNYWYYHVHDGDIPGDPASGWYSTTVKADAWMSIDLLEAHQPTNMPAADTTLILRMSREDEWDESPKLLWVKSLAAVNVPSWEPYIETKMLTALETITFYGRWEKKGPTTGRKIAIPGDMSPGYRNVSWVKGNIVGSTENILSSASGGFFTLTRDLTVSETLEFTFSYNVHVLITQSLDMVEVSDFPVLFLSEISTPRSHWAPRLYSLIDKGSGSFQAWTFPAPAGARLGFNLVVGASLYWDASAIMGTLSKLTEDGWFINLSDLNLNMVLEAKGDVNEALSGLVRIGNKGLQRHFQLTYPCPVSYLTSERFVNEFVVSRFRLGR